MELAATAAEVLARRAGGATRGLVQLVSRSEGILPGASASARGEAERALRRLGVSLLRGRWGRAPPPYQSAGPGAPHALRTCAADVGLARSRPAWREVTRLAEGGAGGEERKPAAAADAPGHGGEEGGEKVVLPPWGGCAGIAEACEALAITHRRFREQLLRRAVDCEPKRGVGYDRLAQRL